MREDVREMLRRSVEEDEAVRRETKAGKRSGYFRGQGGFSVWVCSDGDVEARVYNSPPPDAGARHVATYTYMPGRGWREKG